MSIFGFLYEYFIVAWYCDIISEMNVNTYAINN
jgi:hypothetical protein